MGKKTNAHAALTRFATFYSTFDWREKNKNYISQLPRAYVNYQWRQIHAAIDHSWTGELCSGWSFLEKMSKKAKELLQMDLYGLLGIDSSATEKQVCAFG